MESIVSDRFVTTTLVGSKLMIQKMLTNDYDDMSQYTLNSHFNIQPNAPFPTNPQIKYFGVGTKGCYNADDGILSSAYNPERTNLNLYNLIPIRCRPIDDDISDSERSKYRLRTRATINGNEYWLYYLKMLTLESTNVTFKRYTLSGKQEEYELSRDNLNPKPTKPSVSTSINNNEAQVAACINASVIVEASEILEYIRVAHNGDTRYAKISELGLFAGEDIKVSGTTSQGATITYDEATGVLLFNHSTWLGTTLSHEGYSYTSKFTITNSGVALA